MKEIIVRKTKSGKKTAMPMMVKHIVKNVRMQEQDLSEDFPVAHKAERELGSLKRKVSPELSLPTTIWLIRRAVPVLTWCSMSAIRGLLTSRDS